MEEICVVRTFLGYYLATDDGARTTQDRRWAFKFSSHADAERAVLAYARRQGPVGNRSTIEAA